MATGFRGFLIGAAIFAALLFVGCAAQTQGEIDRYYREGRYDEGLVLAQKELEAAQARTGSGSLETAAAMNMVARGYLALGDLGRAEPLLRQALAIREKNLGPTDLKVATSLDNLAQVLSDRGDWAQAEPLYKRALDIREKALGPNHPERAVSMGNLAALYYHLGDLDRAAGLYKGANEILERTGGDQSQELATGLDNLAAVYAAMGRLDQAEPLFSRAHGIRKNLLGENHPDLAVSLNNMGWLYLSLNQTEKAASSFKQALAITEKVYGQGHPRVAASLNNLAVLAAREGKYDQAEAQYTRALDLWKAAYGSDHPDVAESLANLAVLNAQQGRYPQAHGLFMEALAVDRKVIDQVLGFTSEEEKARFLVTRQTTMEQALCLAARHRSGDSGAARDALAVWLSRKGIILDAQKRFQEALIQADDPKARQVFKNLSQVRADLSRLALAGPETADSRTYREETLRLNNKKNDLEAELARLSQAYALKKKVDQADPDAVARALPANATLVEFALVSFIDFQAPTGQDPWRPAHYLAFVLPAGAPARVRLVDLGPADALDQAVLRFRKAIMDVRRDASGQRALAASREIHDRVMAPLLPHLAGTGRLFLSPDGALNLIPFEILQGADGRFLVETWPISYLSSGRDLAGFGAGDVSQAKSLLVGDPNFDLTPSQKSQIITQRGLTPPLGPALRSADTRGLRLKRLAGTRNEVEAIQKILGPDRADLLVGDMALEEALVQVVRPQVLHLATHGFFLSDAQMSKLAGRPLDPGKKQAPRIAVNPLIRSGLALAGANQGSGGASGTGDGVLTAEEVLALNLRGTRMVVLSACETGVGEVQSGEGVYGLRRAFAQAGARSLVMSLWSVPDQETEELMLGFYRRMAAGSDRAMALREAVLEEKAAVEKRYGHANPFFWGAFVFLGEP